MPGDRGKKRQRRDSDAGANLPAAAAAESSTGGGRRLFGRKKKGAAAAADDVLSADAAAKMAERKAQRENLRNLRERPLSDVEAKISPPPAARRRSPRKSPAKKKAAAAKPAAAASSPPLLIILRGPAAAGKSTIAHTVVDKLRGAGRSVCLLEQDYFRNVALGHGPESAAVSAKMLKGCADAALERGYDVVLEGILNSDSAKGGHYRPLLAGLVARADEAAESSFRADVGLFYLDVPLKTTKLRHNERAKSADFGPEKLDEWWKSSQKTGLAGEVALKAAKSGGEAGILSAATEVFAHLGLGPNGLPL
jgi:thymidylate kinase